MKILLPRYVTRKKKTAGRETGRCMSVAAMQALHRLRECRLLCDAVVRVDDGAAFPVHRAILSACSPYFLALFTTTLHSREQSDVVISGVRSEILLLLIEYAYLRRIEVTDTNVHELLMTADYLAFLGVLQLCCDHLRSSLNPKNCLGIMMFARRIFCYKLEADARRYLLRYFVTVATESEEFLHLPLEELNSIILEDELNVKSEEAVWEAVLRWVNHEPDTRWESTVKLMGSIRLGLLDTQFFLENVKDHPYVTGNEGSRPIIIETLKFLYDLEMIAQRDGEVATPEIARPRVPHEVLFAIGGWSGGSPTAFIETYDTRADRWIKVEEVDPAGPRAYHGTAVLGNCIYVIGGFDGMDYFNSCRCFDAVTKNWREVAPMNARRCYVSVAVLGETIYAMGGYDGHHRQNTAERFNHRTNQWSLVAPMNAQRSDASAAALDNKIYITGGFNGQECMNSVEVYDPDANQWTNLAPMRSRRSGVSCISYHNKIYVIGGFNGISRMCSGEVYDPSTNTWAPVPDMYNPRSNFAIEVIDDMIFAIGGFNGVTTIYHVECYDEKTNEWYEATDMNIYRSALSACVIMGLPNVYDYIHKHRERLMEEKRQKILLSETARHGAQHRTTLPDLPCPQVHLMEDNDNMLEQLGLIENHQNNAVLAPPPPPPPLPPPPPQRMDLEEDNN
ncbi:kelch-like protein 10 isoform X2 [Plutella xylostella]|uniref:kelch-like protein 10 isoform X2 n=1 Tax=Plutella xylostella TaxID=51655 RepID=UPI0020325442|nr:kelch-like protein 10 isoform X2 [Plutella xylostella]